MHKDLSNAFDLEGRVAVITGAASGIGRETARVLAMAGAHVVLVDVDRNGLAETAVLIKAVGGTAIVRPADVAERQAIDRIADETVRAMERLDIWVNAAGVLTHAPIVETKEPELERVLAVNQKGTYWGCAAAGRVMCRLGRGSIVNLSSAGADSTPPGLSVYAMSKGAVNALTRTAAREFGPSGVRVNAVAPGFIDTPMVAHNFRNAAGEIDAAQREQALRQIAQASPLGLTGTTRDVALTVLYLASDAARFVTGQVLHTNGGVLMR